MSLFRKEVAEARQSSNMGVVRLAQPIGFTASALAAVLLAGLFVALLICAQITRKTSAPGVLVPRAGMARVVSSQAGVIAQVLVNDGDHVAAGQALAIVNSDRTTARGDLTVRQASSLQERRAALRAEADFKRRQAKERSTSLSSRILKAERELVQAQDERDLIRRRATLAGRTQDRYVQLQRDGFVSEAQVQQKEEGAIEFAARRQGAERAVLSLARELDAMRAELSAMNLQLQTELAQIERSLASISQEEAEFDARASTLVTAPAAGIVSLSDVYVGKAVEAGQTLLNLIPAGSSGDLMAQLYTTSRGVGIVEPGQTVYVRYAAFPYQRFGLAHGEVRAVSRTPIAPQDLPLGRANALLAAAQSTEPLYRIDVDLASQQVVAHGQLLLLKPGMALEADVVSERLALWEWVFEPLMAAKARIDARKHSAIRREVSPELMVAQGFPQ